MSAIDLPDAQPARPAPSRLPRLSPAGMIGLGIVALLLVTALFADQIAPFSPIKMGSGRPLQPPSWAHLAGTDTLGRDMFSRIVHGARFTLIIGAIAVGISMSIGMLLGIVAAYGRGWLEAILMRTSDVLFTFTDTLIALGCVAVLGPSLENAMIAVGIAGIPLYARTAYAAAVVERSKPYFEGSLMAGAGPVRMIVMHLIPNIMPTMIVIATLGISGAILAAAGLSFLGLGAQPPSPEWGAMLSTGRDYFNRAPWLMWFPGIAIAVVVLGFNLLGDALREWLDPKERSR